jgi:hypothetical protein
VLLSAQQAYLSLSCSFSPLLTNCSFACPYTHSTNPYYTKDL